MAPIIEVSSEREGLSEKVRTNLHRGTKICFECHSNALIHVVIYVEISTARV